MNNLLIKESIKNTATREYAKNNNNNNNKTAKQNANSPSKRKKSLIKKQ